jgi:uncharacterized LabA/DUF88 family protein
MTNYDNVPDQIMNIIKDTDTVSVYVDGYNATMASKAISLSVDWTKFAQLFRVAGRLRDLNFYISSMDNQSDGSAENSSWSNLLGWLAHNSYSVVAKTGPQYTYELDTGTRKVTLSGIKTGIELNIVADAMMSAVNRVDHVILFTTNDDYLPLVHNLQKAGVIVTIICNSLKIIKEMRSNNDEQVPSVHIPKQCIYYANNLVELKSLSPYIKKDESGD